MYDYTIYAYFNSAQIQSVLNAIVMLMGSGGVGGDYLGLIKVAASLGIMIAVVAGTARARGEDAAAYIIAMALFYGTLFVPTASVTIVDAGTGGGASAPLVVANVPIGVAFFGSTTSQIGHWLTERTETFFSYPDQSLKYSSGGMMGGARALREAQNAVIPDPVLLQNMVNFMRDCVNPELLANPAALSSLLQSRDIWSDLPTLSLINNGRAMTDVSSNALVFCNDAYTAFTPLIGAAATSEQKRIAMVLNPGQTAVNANTILGSLLPAAEGLMMTASASAQVAIQQRMMINLMNDTGKSIGQLNNDPNAVQNSMATAMAEQSANSAYVVMAKVAADALPLIHNAMELVVLSVFPIVFILIIIAGTQGGVVLKSYVMTMLWVQLWAPLYAIVHFVAQSQSAKSMGSALNGIDGVSISNASAFVGSAISSEAIAGMLTIAVPMIALAIIKGGEVAMSGITSSVLGPAQSAGQSAGASAGVGNYSAGNMQWGNYSSGNSSSGQTNNAMSYSSPESATLKSATGTQQWNAGGMEGMQVTSGISGAGTAGFGRSDGRAKVAESTESAKFSSTYGASGSTSETSGLGTAISASVAKSWNDRAEHGHGGSTTNSTNTKATDSKSVDNAQETHATNDTSQVLSGTAGGGFNSSSKGSGGDKGGAPGAGSGKGGGSPLSSLLIAKVEASRKHSDGSGTKESTGTKRSKQLAQDHGEMVQSMDQDISTMSNGKSKDAAIAVRNDYVKQAQASIQKAEQAESGQSASVKTTDSSSAQTSVSSGQNMALYTAAQQLQPGITPDRFAHQMSHDTGFQNQVYQQAMSNLQPVTQGNKDSIAPAPQSLSAIKSEGAGNVEKAGAENSAVVASQQNENNATAKKAQFTNPNSGVDHTASNNAFKANYEGAKNGYGAAARTKNAQSANSDAAAAAMKAVNPNTPGSLAASVVDSTNRGDYQSVQDLVPYMAATNPEFKSELAKSQAQGSLTPGAAQYIKDHASKDHDSMNYKKFQAEHAKEFNDMNPARSIPSAKDFASDA